MIQFCCDTLRRAELRGGPLNGIDFIEVLDRDAVLQDQRQRFIHVHLINEPGALIFTPENIRILGGDRIQGFRILTVVMGLGPQTNVVVVEVDRPGDFSTYTLQLVRSALDDRPPVDFDPILSTVAFTFKAECPTDFDCKPLCECPEDDQPTPQIDYLAKDYQSFLTVMRDRMALITPDWNERSAADAMVTVMELLAWTADQISSAQDYALREAFLNRCTSRISARRLVRLVDYFIGEGTNARVHVQLAVSADVIPLNPAAPPVLPVGTTITTLLPEAGATIAPDPALLETAQTVFETMHDVEALFAAHNEMAFYTWSDQRCCLPKGATSATLAGHFPDLVIGETLIFEEVLGPRTGRSADADPNLRQPVRLTSIVAFDQNGGPLSDPLTGDAVTQIDWDEGDALTFPLCLSAETDPESGARFLPIVSVARGNVVLADHGRTIADENLGTVPEPPFRWVGPDECDPCDRQPPVFAPPRFTPSLALWPVTHAEPFDPARSATRALEQDAARSVPAARLVSMPGAAEWTAQRDLLASGPFADEFVVEIENDHRALVRLGDDLNGHRPEPGTDFTATYRIGLGTSGAIGGEALRHIAIAIPEITAVRNPLAATGGEEPESLASIRSRAPFAFRTQERAVTRADYAEVTQRLDSIQRAAATWRHTGSWLTVFISADRFGGAPVDAPFEAVILDHLERFRMAGYDLNADGPRFVPLELDLLVCVKGGHFRSDVHRALRALLGANRAPDGSPGLFHPDRLIFGETVYLSPVLAAVQATPGVESVRATLFRRLGDTGEGGLEDGFLTFERLEIAQLDNDPNFPDRGVLRLRLSGGI